MVMGNKRRVVIEVNRGLMAITRIDERAQLAVINALANDQTVIDAAAAAVDAEPRIAATFDVWPSGSQATDIQNVTTMAAQIAANGGKVIRLAPGDYDFAGVTPDDIFDLYIVGDSVTVTPTSWIYPFSSVESIRGSYARQNTGGRGRIAIELDDGLRSHWTQLFPVTKELGIPMSAAWHTGNGEEWIKEAYRHGWEIMSHLPENVGAPTHLANGTLDAVAQESLDAIRAVTGQERVGFVYPMHQRSDETDRVLSKYYSFGRGIADLRTYPRGVPRPWLAASYFLDTQFSVSGVSDRVRRQLQTIAEGDLSATYYMHYQSATGEASIAGLRDFVATARSLGIEFTTASQILGVQPVNIDPYFESTALWTLPSAASWDTGVKYHGERSIKITPAGAGFTNAMITQAAAARVPVPTIPGHFTVLRASIRRKNDTPVTVSANGSGIIFGVSFQRRGLDGTAPNDPYGPISQPFPVAGVTLDASPDWTRVATPIYVPPDTASIALLIHVQNVAAGSPEFWLDEFKVEVVDYVSAVRLRGTLAGTANVFVYGGVLEPHLRHSVQLLTDAPPVGAVTATWGTYRATVKSTSASDTMGFTLLITPGPSYKDDAFPATGA